MSRGRSACRRPSSSAADPSGYTLIELLIVVALLGILAGIAVPGYRSHVVRANRAEARVALLALATAQEKFHLECHRYAIRIAPALEADCEAERLPFPPRSERGYYELDITSADESGWSATASTAGPPQNADTRCRRLQLDGTGHRSAVDDGGADRSLECWSR